MLKELMQTTNFRVTVVEESDVVEICGALKVDVLLWSNLMFKHIREPADILIYVCAFKIHKETCIKKCNGGKDGPGKSTFMK